MSTAVTPIPSPWDGLTGPEVMRRYLDLRCGLQDYQGLYNWMTINYPEEADFVTRPTIEGYFDIEEQGRDDPFYDPTNQCTYLKSLQTADPDAYATIMDVCPLCSGPNFPKLPFAGYQGITLEKGLSLKASTAIADQQIYRIEVGLSSRVLAVDPDNGRVVLAEWGHPWARWRVEADEGNIRLYNLEAQAYLDASDRRGNGTLPLVLGKNTDSGDKWRQLWGVRPVQQTPDDIRVWLINFLAAGIWLNLDADKDHTSEIGCTVMIYSPGKDYAPNQTWRFYPVPDATLTGWQGITVGLKAGNGKWVRTSYDPDSFLRASGRAYPSWYEQFRMIRLTPNRVALVNLAGRYVSSDYSGALTASENSVGTDGERFEIDPPMRNGGRDDKPAAVTLKSLRTGKFVRVGGAENPMLLADAPTQNAAERFTVLYGPDKPANV